MIGYNHCILLYAYKCYWTFECMKMFIYILANMHLFFFLFVFLRGRPIDLILSPQFFFGVG